MAQKMVEILHGDKEGEYGEIKHFIKFDYDPKFYVMELGDFDKGVVDAEFQASRIKAVKIYFADVLKSACKNLQVDNAACFV